MAEEMPGTDTAEEELEIPLTPNCIWLLSPQHLTPPSASTAHPEYAVPVIWTAFDIPSFIATGVSRLCKHPTCPA